MTGQDRWIPRAVLAVIGTGLCVIGFLIFAVWLYRQTVPVAPDWLIQPRRARGRVLLGDIWLMGTIFVSLAMTLFLGLGLFRLLRVPAVAIDPGSRVLDYPRDQRPQSKHARSQPGSAGFIDHQLDRLAAASDRLKDVEPAGKRSRPGRE